MPSSPVLSQTYTCTCTPSSPIHSHAAKFIHSVIHFLACMRVPIHNTHTHPHPFSLPPTRVPIHHHHPYTRTHTHFFIHSSSCCASGVSRPFESHPCRPRCLWASGEVPSVPSSSREACAAFRLASWAVRGCRHGGPPSAVTRLFPPSLSLQLSLKMLTESA